jgi:hypothetical protein
MNPTPEEKCSHDWQKYKSSPQPVCFKCGVVKPSPSPEAKCKCEDLKVDLDWTVWCPKCGEKLLVPIKPPAPEARVDWEKEAKKLLKQEERTVGTNYPLYDCTPHWWKRKYQVIAKALQAAFEKGREAR